MSIEVSTAGQDFACSNCGQVYQSAFACCCPYCRSGVVHQVRMAEEDLHQRQSYARFKKSTSYRSKIEARNPELIPTYVDMVESIKDYADSSVIIDWLAFTAPLADFRHCKKSGDFSGIPFPDAPVTESFTVKTAEDAQSIQDFQKKIYTVYLEEVLRVFIQRVLGFSFGSMRGSGFNFYEDSFSLMSDSGEEFCGQVGIGGNNDTVHFSISGSGCKHLFANRSRQFVHHWLANVLGITLLTRIDLAADDFDGIHSPEDAEKIWGLGGFKRSRGFSPKMGNKDEKNIIGDETVFYRRERVFGSRQSLVYWRIYDKKLEQKIEKNNFTWCRSEVELKKAPVEILLNPAGYFVGLNEYAASILHTSVTPERDNTKSKKRLACDVLSSVVHLKKQYGRIVNSLFDLFDGDAEKIISMLVRDDSKLSFPSIHKKLINCLE